jgi:hypothetical protein
MIIRGKVAMEQELDAFRRRQAARLVEIAEACEDPELKKRLLEMAEDWLKACQTLCQREDDTR